MRHLRVAISVVTIAFWANFATAATVFTDEAAFLAATSGLNENGFETARLTDQTTIDFDDGTFSCVGTEFCPGFFGISQSNVRTGNQSVFFATPDAGVFDFDTPISAFGIFIGGLGNIDTTTLTVTNNRGETRDIYVDLSRTGSSFDDNVLFAGILDSVGFTRIAFSGTAPFDGIFFDDLRFGTSELSAVPLPGALPLFLMGMIGLARSLRRR